jgi:hypothetical protein
VSARTIVLGDSLSPCPSCVGESIDPPKTLIQQIEVSASGFAQMLVMKCPTHGPIKKLYSDRPSSTFKALYPEFFTEAVGAEILAEPKPTKWA